MTRKYFCMRSVLNSTAPANRSRDLTPLAILAGAVVFSLANVARVRAQSPPADAAPAPSFEVASIKPNHSGDNRIGIMFQPGRFHTSGASVKQLIGLAYDVRDFQISGGPGWISTDRYDIDAKEPDGFSEAVEKLPPDQRHEKMMLLIQSLLTDRFQLKVSHTTKELPVYALVVGKNGPKLQEAKPLDTGPNAPNGPDAPIGPGGNPHPGPPPPGPRGPGMMRMGPGQLNGQGVTMGFLATVLSGQLGRTVLDQTGLKGNYDFTLKWSPEQGPAAMAQGPPGGGPPPDAGPTPDASGPSVFTAVQEQLGLKLESAKGPVDILVIDHVEKPTEN